MGLKKKPALIIKTSGAAICNMDKHDMINRLKSVKYMVEQRKKNYRPSKCVSFVW